MPKVYNKNRDSLPIGAVYIGRPSRYGNPFHIGVDGTRAEVIEKYRQYVLNTPSLLHAVQTKLKGKDLACYCKPKPCHGDVLLEIANPSSRPLFGNP